eukprot:2879673-Amphidinium_carterae.1
MGSARRACNVQEAQRKCGRERIEAVSKLVNDAMVLRRNDDNTVGVYKADPDSCIAQELIRQSTEQYK